MVSPAQNNTLGALGRGRPLANAAPSASASPASSASAGVTPTQPATPPVSPKRQELLTILSQVGKDDLTPPDIALQIGNRISQNSVSNPDKADYARELAAIYNTSTTPEAQREAIRATFLYLAGQNDNAGMIFAGLIAAPLLNEPTHTTLKSSIEAFIDLRQRNFESAKDRAVEGAFTKATIAFTKAHPQKMGTIIESLMTAWSQDPAGKFIFFDTLSLISRESGACPIAIAGSTQNLSLYQAVSQSFWKNHYAKMALSRRIEIMHTLTQHVGTQSNTLQTELIVTAIAKDPEKVVDAIEEEYQKFTAEEKRDPATVALIKDALVARRLADCKDDTCRERVRAKFKVEEETTTQFAIGTSLAAIGAHSITGEAFSQTNAGLGITADWLLGSEKIVSRPYVGLYSRFSPNVSFLSAGIRSGYEHRISEGGRMRLGLEVGYLRLKGAEREKDDIPVQVTGITPDRHAYILQPMPIDRIVSGGQAMISAEFDQHFSHFLSGFVGLGFGGILGSVADDGCSYTYQPGSDATLRPGSNGSYTATSSAQLGTRCRSKETTFGAAFSGQLGLRGTF